MTNKIFCHFGLFFATFALTAQKIKKLKKDKNPWRYHHFTHLYQKLLSIMTHCCKWNYNPLNLKLLFLQYQSNQNTLEYLIKGGVGINERPRLENSSKFNKQGCVAINF